MKEYIFIIKRHGNDKYGNKLYHVYAAWKDLKEEHWTSFYPDALKSLGLGRVIKEEYITTNMYRHEIVYIINKIYKGKEHSFLTL